VPDKDRDKEWEDILDEIELTYLPIEYLKNIIVTFDNGTVWDIDIASSKQKQNVEDIETSLDQLFEEYDDTIETVDFRLDIERVKRDLSKRVNRFLKKKT
jgi:hypothetical protein